jgi:hypothetical protein
MDLMQILLQLNANLPQIQQLLTELEMLFHQQLIVMVKQAADNYAAIQIEAAKNKLSNIKDNNDTRSLINYFCCL